MSRGGNLRGAPLFPRPSVVRGLIEGVQAIQKGLAQVPVEPVKLVDVPRPSTSSGRAVVETTRLAKANDDFPASRRVAPPVASEPEDWPDAPLPDESGDPVADPDLDRPEPQDGTLAALPAADLIPDSAIGNGIALKRAPKIDWKRVAAARRAKAAAKPAPAPRPLFPAPSRDACPRCGIPGSKGCAHFLPCEDAPPPPPSETELRKQPKFTGKRQGISVLRI